MVEKRSRFWIWLWLITIVAGLYFTTYNIQRLIGRVNQLEIQIQRLEQREHPTK